MNITPRTPLSRVLRSLLVCATAAAVVSAPTLPTASATPGGAVSGSTAGSARQLSSDQVSGVQASSIKASRKPVLRLGAAASDQAAFDAFDSEAGVFDARRTYNSTLPASFMKSLARTDVAAGRTSYWSFRPNPKTFYKDKKAQRAFSKFLDTIPKGHQTVVVALHEPEDEIRAKKFSLKQWAKTNNAVGKIIHSKKRSELRHGICLMGPWTFDSRSPYYGYKWEKVLDMKYVDVVGIDPYKFRRTDPSLRRMLTKSNSGNGKTKNPSVMAKLSKWGKPVALMEFGVNAKDRYTGAAIPDTARAAWISDGITWMRDWNSNHKVKIEAALYFQLHPGGPYLTGKAVDALDDATR